MIRRNVWCASVVAAALLVGGAVAFAQGPGRPGPRGDGPFGGGVARGLDLSETQRQQIRAVTEQHGDAVRAAAERVRTAREAQRKVLSAMPLDEGQVRATTQGVVDAETELALERARIRSEVFALLTPDQQAQVQKNQASLESRLQERRERLRERAERRLQRRG